MLLYIRTPEMSGQKLVNKDIAKGARTIPTPSLEILLDMFGRYS